METQTLKSDPIRNHWDLLSSKKTELESQANDFTSKCIDRLASLTSEYELVAMDREREIHASRAMQKENLSLRTELEKLKQRLTRNSSVLILIDGDGLLFEDEYVRAGESGGIEAARELHDRINKHIRNSLPDMPSDTKYLVRIYANMYGLAKAYYDGGICEPAVVQQFARGFTKSRAYFDFVDCGHAKERADSKIAASFNLYLHNMQTEHIILGCSHDNGYARLLEEIRPDDCNKISLLEGVPFARELVQLKHMFSTVKFDGLFRDTKIEALSKFHEPISSDAALFSSSPPGFSSARHNSYPAASSSENDTQNIWQEIPGRSSSKTNTDPTFTKVPTRSKTPSTSSPGPTPASLLSGASGNWAGKVSSIATVAQSEYQQHSPGDSGSAVPAIRRNRAGQRLDPPKPKDLDNATIYKVQDMKLCNNHHLRGVCYKSGCEHDHKYKTSRLEQKALEHIARRIPCHHGTECDDPKCIAGHRCPFIVQGSCPHHDRLVCRFSNAMHHNDTVEVKTTLVR